MITNESQEFITSSLIIFISRRSLRLISVCVIWQIDCFIRLERFFHFIWIIPILKQWINSSRTKPEWKKKIKKRSSHFVQIKPIFEINDAGVGVIVQALQLTFRTCDFHFKINKTDHLLLLCCSAYTLCCRILNDISMKKKHKYHFGQNCRFDVFCNHIQNALIFE